VNKSTIFTGGQIFDGTVLHAGKAARFVDGIFDGLISSPKAKDAEATFDLEGDILSLGYVDLQVNGGDGVMFNDDPSVETLTRMAQAHRRLGATLILPTLITDTPEKTQAAIEIVARGTVSGIAGLHLEGPHLSIARKGAHDAKYIRPMSETDLNLLVAAKAKLPILKITVAPENVTTKQVSKLARAGILISLGHTDADFDTCLSYARAGARCVTHLFNAMSQLNNRAPGVVGAALESGKLSAGLIADGVHVHSAAMRMAWAAKTGPGQIFLVSDAMAVAGTDMDSFQLDGRAINRSNGQLRLADGTLAGADLDLTTAISVLVNQVGIPLEEALAAATRVPAWVAGMLDYRLQENVTPARDLIRISRDLSRAQPLCA
jgi:N-acetylglucosamine-6-phosphate deacetylase